MHTKVLFQESNWLPYVELLVYRMSMESLDIAHGQCHIEHLEYWNEGPWTMSSCPWMMSRESMYNVHSVWAISMDNVRSVSNFFHLTVLLFWRPGIISQFLATFLSPYLLLLLSALVN